MLHGAKRAVTEYRGLCRGRVIREDFSEEGGAHSEAQRMRRSQSGGRWRRL